MLLEWIPKKPVHSALGAETDRLFSSQWKKIINEPSAKQ
jgi:hypothetical protein